MTAKIVPFPVNSEQDSTEVEKLIRLWLREQSADSELNDCVTARMMSFISEYASKTFEPTFNLAAPAHMSETEAEALLDSVKKGLDDAAFQVQEMINKIIIERFFLELEMQTTARKPHKLAVFPKKTAFSSPQPKA